MQTKKQRITVSSMDATRSVGNFRIPAACCICKTRRHRIYRLSALSSTRLVSIVLMRGIDPQLFWRLGSNEQKTIITMIKRVYRRCNEVAKGELGTIMAFVTRFLQRTLKNIAHESRAPSRMPSPAPGETNGRDAVMERQHIDEVTFDIVSSNWLHCGSLRARADS